MGTPLFRLCQALACSDFGSRAHNLDHECSAGFRFRGDNQHAGCRVPQRASSNAAMTFFPTTGTRGFMNLMTGDLCWERCESHDVSVHWNKMFGAFVSDLKR